jgi:GT2 family glycosyltransferase
MVMYVVIATVGRADIVRRTVDSLADQSRPPDGVIIIGAQASDVDGLESARGNLIIGLSPGKGSSRQRNQAIERLPACDTVVFLDDDIVLAQDYLAEAERLLLERPEVVGATGRMIADGVHNDGYDFDEAVALVAADLRPDPPGEEIREVLYGCNMVFRASAIGDIRFDEALPLYGWLEDVDFAYRIGKGGVLVRTGRLNSVHMGAKSGRTSGRRLGYSQMVNPIYLLRKRSIPPKLARSLIVQNFLSNLMLSVRPEPLIDRRGRLIGNLIGMADLLRRRAHPARIIELG